MNQKRLYKVFIWGFLFLYLLVAAISFFHAIQFFGVGNNTVMSVVLAFAFEIGLALSLAAVLLSDANKRATLPWILMIVLTAVQVVGNVFSTYKYIALSETEYYQYLAEPLLFWMEGVTEESVRIVVSWIIGAILPIIALFMTDMVATNIKNLNALKNAEQINEPINEPKNEPKPVEEKKEQAVEETPLLDIKPTPVPATEKPAEVPATETKWPDRTEELLEDPMRTVKFSADGFIEDEESEPSVEEEKPVTDEINSADADFLEAAVSEAKVPAEKPGLLKKIGNGLKNLWLKG